MGLWNIWVFVGKERHWKTFVLVNPQGPPLNGRPHGNFMLWTPGKKRDICVIHKLNTMPDFSHVYWKQHPMSRPSASASTHQFSEFSVCSWGLEACLLVFVVARNLVFSSASRFCNTETIFCGSGRVPIILLAVSKVTLAGTRAWRFWQVETHLIGFTSLPSQSRDKSLLSLLLDMFLFSHCLRVISLIQGEWSCVETIST